MRLRVARFEDLDVYRAAHELQERIFNLSRGWPREERHALSDQIRRSSRSIGANIAEAWAKRRYKAHFVSKLTDADGEQAETRHWLSTAKDCTYIDAITCEELNGACLHIGAMLGKMMADSADWVQR